MSRKRKQKYHERRLALIDKQGRERQVRIEFDVMEMAHRLWPELFEKGQKAQEPEQKKDNLLPFPK